MLDHKQGQDRSTTGGRRGWDSPRTNEQPSWSRRSAGGGGYNQGPAGGWGGGYGGGAPAPQVKFLLVHLSNYESNITIIYIDSRLVNWGSSLHSCVEVKRFGAAVSC